MQAMVFSKCVELATESVPGCVFQLYVWMRYPDQAGSYALVSILISTLSTGFISAMISFDLDVDVKKRKTNPDFYGYVMDDHEKRGRCFKLMMAISACHNMSRTTGYAILALIDKRTLLLFWVGEFLPFSMYMIWNFSRFYYHITLTNLPFVMVIEFISISVKKIILDFTGCFHWRHPYLGCNGRLYSASLVWSQIFPFVALFLLNKQENADLMTDGAMNTVTIILVCSSIAWLLMNIAFFCTIDLAYLHTFFSTQTPQQFVISNFKNRDSDYGKFDAAFDNEIGLSRPIHGEIKQWIKENIQQWRDETPAWFKVEVIPDEFLPVEIYEAEGGARRRRSSVGINSVREMIGLGARAEMSSTKVHPGGVGLGQNEGQETS